MTLKYNFVSIKSIKRIIFLFQLSKIYDVKEKLIEFSSEIANLLDSKILFDKLYEFPSDLNNIKNYTYLAVLSTSHIAISTYISKEEAYLDMEIVWCSEKDISKEEFLKIVIKHFNIDTNKKYRYLKIDYKGKIIDEDGFLT